MMDFDDTYVFGKCLVTMVYGTHRGTAYCTAVLYLNDLSWLSRLALSDDSIITCSGCKNHEVFLVYSRFMVFSLEQTGIPNPSYKNGFNS